MTSEKRVPGSFRDPSGFLFERAGELYRQINAPYLDHYQACKDGGLYDALWKDGLLVEHDEADLSCAFDDDARKVIKPHRVPFISYPYEWCFSQLKDAALLTLDLHQRALDRNLVLKDASAFNVQFVRGRPVLIDSLSFESYVEGSPWVAYGQFCRHFLGPLAAMATRGAHAGTLWRQWIDGPPLELVADLLPWRTRLRPGLAIHIHAHARMLRSESRATTKIQKSNRQMNKRAHLGLVDNLRSTVSGLKYALPKSGWSEYYEETDHSQAYYRHKEEVITESSASFGPRVWDLGANTGRFSRIAAERAELVVSMDGDHDSVERHYGTCREGGRDNVLPIWMDLNNPSPALGWEQSERMSLLDRGDADAALALALVHHLAIGNNVPLPRVASFLARCAKRLVIEFVPKNDPRVQDLLAIREDVFDDYSQSGFERAFAQHFQWRDPIALADSGRLLYDMTKSDTA